MPEQDDDMVRKISMIVGAVIIGIAIVLGLI